MRRSNTLVAAARFCFLILPNSAKFAGRLRRRREPPDVHARHQHDAAANQLGAAASSAVDHQRLDGQFVDGRQLARHRARQREDGRPERGAVDFDRDRPDDAFRARHAEGRAHRAASGDRLAQRRHADPEIHRHGNGHRAHRDDGRGCGGRQLLGRRHADRHVADAVFRRIQCDAAARHRHADAERRRQIDVDLDRFDEQHAFRHRRRDQLRVEQPRRDGDDRHGHRRRAPRAALGKHGRGQRDQRRREQPVRRQRAVEPRRHVDGEHDGRPVDDPLGRQRRMDAKHLRSGRRIHGGRHRRVEREQRSVGCDRRRHAEPHASRRRRHADAERDHRHHRAGHRDHERRQPVQHGDHDDVVAVVAIRRGHQLAKRGAAPRRLHAQHDPQLARARGGRGRDDGRLDHVARVDRHQVRRRLVVVADGRRTDHRYGQAQRRAAKQPVDRRRALQFDERHRRAAEHHDPELCADGRRLRYALERAEPGPEEPRAAADAARVVRVATHVAIQRAVHRAQHADGADEQQLELPDAAVRRQQQLGRDGEQQVTNRTRWRSLKWIRCR
ncbi:hypothetical protein BURPS1710b_0091 [Burkholderia pseudomallei 1710b]|uniref:Uncharacterized protein n=1 Tax=Burkholderia pseudomallei (strain 1710b) TaxID=320372 RepID=Q3JY45_BURP1|nr:hypothetical protein BURPS1710b_0091 [Burkholderia pseudomallei 1710b]